MTIFAPKYSVTNLLSHQPDSNIEADYNMGQYRERQETILWTVKERNNVVRVSFSLSILKLAEVRDCNDSMRKVVVILLESIIRIN